MWGAGRRLTACWAGVARKQFQVSFLFVVSLGSRRPFRTSSRVRIKKKSPKMAGGTAAATTIGWSCGFGGMDMLPPSGPRMCMCILVLSRST